MSYADGRFVDPLDVDAMEEEVASKRKAPPRKRTKGTSARLHDDILDECEESFIAAQEKVTKASKNYYADTGLMALLCRHDRALYVVNLTSPGERQHYALALLHKLFEALPPDWMVGVLYDIACQLSRSIEKVHLHALSSYGFDIVCSTTCCTDMHIGSSLACLYFTRMVTSGLVSWFSTLANARASGSLTGKAASASGALFVVSLPVCECPGCVDIAHARNDTDQGIVPSSTLRAQSSNSVQRCPEPAQDGTLDRAQMARCLPATA